MPRLVYVFVLALIAAGADAQPTLGWAAADTLYADFQDQFTYVAAPEEGARGLARGVGATFDVEYVGFPDEARAAFQFGVDIWSRHLESSVPIRVRATWEPAGDANVLGATNPRVIANFERAPEREVWFAVALANALAGRDLDRDDPHIRTTFNSEFPNWYFGTDGRPPAGKFDLVTIVLHELAHGLGFVGSMLVDGSQGTWGIEVGRTNQLLPVIFDRFAERGDGTGLLDTSRFPNPSRSLADVLQSEDLFFDGQAAVRAQNGTRPQLHAPSDWENGSSYSHLSEPDPRGGPYPPGSINSLMTPTIGATEVVHAPGPIVCGMFQDMGWPLGSACATQVPVDPEDPPQVAVIEIDDRQFVNPIGDGTGVARLDLTSTAQQAVDVLLFDTLGRRVATLFEGSIGEGQTRSVEVDGRGLASGVYFVWIKSADFFESRAVTVIR